MFKRILVGFDGSASSVHALRVGLGMASQATGEATVLIVIPAAHGETEQDRVASFDDDARQWQALAQQVLEDARGRDVTTSVHALSAGDPAKALAAYAQGHGYDLVVVGRHGRGRPLHGGIGRVARSLSESSPCPVLLVGNGDQEGG